MSNTLPFLILLIVALSILRVVSLCAPYNPQFNLSLQNRTSISMSDFLDTNVLTVNLSYNLISNLSSDTFSRVILVKSLDLSYNSMTQLQGDLLSPFIQLVCLQIPYNRLEQLPEEFLKNKVALEELDLSHNNLNSIPVKFFHSNLWRLRVVNLSWNNLVVFHPWPLLLRISVDFDLSHNKISTTGNNLGETKFTNSYGSDITVNLQFNNFTQWNDSFYQDLFGVDENVAEKFIFLIPDLRNNNWTCDCNFYKRTSLMHKSFYLYAKTDNLKIKCYNPPHLRDKRVFYDVALNEFVCNLTSDQNCLIQDNPNMNLVYVDCRNRGLTSMPRSLPLPDGRKLSLNFHGNSIRSLDNVEYADKIESLNLSNNALQFIDGNALRRMNNVIKELDLRKNSLKYVPKEINVLPFEKTYVEDNHLSCDCNMTWMADWVNLAPGYRDKSVQCTDVNGNRHVIKEVTEHLLNCTNDTLIAVSVSLGVLLVIIIILVITAKRCPYETKVILYKIFRIHPRDKYIVDNTDHDMDNDAYISYDATDIHVQQWTREVLVRKLEGKKPFHKLFVPERNLGVGPEADLRAEAMEKSRRIIILLSAHYSRSSWCDFECNLAESMSENTGRVLYILYDNKAVQLSGREPWRSRMNERRVLSLDDKLFWSKLRYELPLKSTVKVENV
ncbi:hypothetical protein CHS0354_003183 [Potamilus streckersoni]|uniref:TIR domain-containing protein n=1 Tax=Potamilus streckersoni TaxID=2493646 RepID=A0AAE0TGG2_9BIVA|nr:hypothetical protein CHS0354_003183 [Potamilus streckersoni]